MLPALRAMAANMRSRHSAMPPAPFSTGTINWALGVDNANTYQLGNDNVSLPLQQATVNMLRDMLAAPATPMSGIVVSDPEVWFVPDGLSVQAATQAQTAVAAAVLRPLPYVITHRQVLDPVVAARGAAALTWLRHSPIRATRPPLTPRHLKLMCVCLAAGRGCTDRPPLAALRALAS